MINIRKLNVALWESVDWLLAGSKLTSNQYCMPALGLLLLRYAYSGFKLVEAEILATRPVRNDRVMPVEAGDFKAKSALYLPCEERHPHLAELLAAVCDRRQRDAVAVESGNLSLDKAAQGAGGDLLGGRRIYRTAFPYAAK